MSSSLKFGLVNPGRAVFGIQRRDRRLWQRVRFLAPAVWLPHSLPQAAVLAVAVPF
eukprot:SAG11_NODE_12547_length_697_cov_2.006689_2_plen_55_part_01